VTASRDDVAEELARYLQSIGLDEPWSDNKNGSTRWAYTEDGELYSADRLAYHADLVEAELAKQAKVSRRGSLGVVVTAGPPGSGKSTALAAAPDLATYRDVDADAFKDPLLMREQKEGNLAVFLDHSLGDRKPVTVRELSGFVHAESTTIASSMRDQCLAAGENIIVHGTLSSLEYTDELLTQLDQFDYSRLVIIDVETSQEHAIDQALGRWWSGRSTDEDGLGGRFIAPEYIRRQYSNGGALSNCAANAALLRDRAVDLGWSVELRTL
jgi:hypothetical protein